MQLTSYHTAQPEEQANIELDPKIILHNAIENAKPVMELAKLKRGGQTYQVIILFKQNIFYYNKTFITFIITRLFRR
jgi:hypothetical protein